MNAIDKIKGNKERAKSALKGSEIANSLAEKAMGVLTVVKKGQAVLSEATTKRLEELSIRAKSNLTHIQRLELARSEKIIIAKGMALLTQAKEKQDELRNAAMGAFQATGSQGITLTYARQLQRVKGDRGTAPPAMRVTLSCLTDKLILYDAVRQKIQEGISIPYSFQNEIPKYALGLHKQLNKVAMEIRRMDRDIKTRVTMTRGDHWPVLMIKRRWATSCELAAQDLIDTAKKNINEAKKATKLQSAQAAGTRAPAASATKPPNSIAADIHAEEEDILLLDDVKMGEQFPSSSSL